MLWDRLRQLNENIHLCDSFRHQVDSTGRAFQSSERDPDGHPSGSRYSIEDCLSVINYSSTTLAVEVLPFISLISKHRGNEDRKPFSSDGLVERLSKFDYPDQKRVRRNEEQSLLSEDEIWDGLITDSESFGEDPPPVGSAGGLHQSLKEVHSSDHPPLDDTKLWFEDEDEIVNSDA